MEILSNWDNASRVGLTELQFFCLKNKKLYVSAHDLDIRNADYPGNLGALVNGKVKVSLCRLIFLVELYGKVHRLNCVCDLYVYAFVLKHLQSVVHDAQIFICK